jgi:hypothetical protein
LFPGFYGWETIYFFNSFYLFVSKQQQQQEERTENVFKILSRPKSINSFYSNERQAKRQKARPNTAVPVIPNQPEQPKAHPRITSGKPRPPTRGI